MKSPNMIGWVTKYEGSRLMLKYLPGRKRERVKGELLQKMRNRVTVAQHVKVKAIYAFSKGSYWNVIVIEFLLAISETMVLK